MSASSTPAPSRPVSSIPWIALVASLALPPAASAQTFTSVATAALAGHVSFSTGASWVDVDADGDLDLFVVTGFSANNNNVLYRNDGGDTFVRVLSGALVTDAADSPCSTWGDYDNDGDLDGFVSSFSPPAACSTKDTAPRRTRSTPPPASAAPPSPAQGARGATTTTTVTSI